MYVEEASPARVRAGGIWQHARQDAILVALSVVHGLVLAALVVAHGTLPVALCVAVVALGLWWNANTIAHNFIHSPFFRAPAMNRIYSIFLSLLLGVPQSLWRERHLAHHAGCAPDVRPRSDVLIEAVAVATLWAWLLLVAPWFMLTVYLPAYVVGMALCFLQGHFEHAPATTSHYGRFYNALFFNDGYHGEHHEVPALHWTRLRDRAQAGPGSPFPPVLRWLEYLSLEGLERIVLRSPRLQAFVLSRHERALRSLLPRMGRVRRVTVVGGGLFPRTAIIFRKLFPGARIRVVDASVDNIAAARRHLAGSRIDRNIEFVHATFEPGEFDASADVLVVPLSLIGRRRKLYTHPPARNVLIHDWIWRRGPEVSLRVSWLLLKRVNLVTGRCGD